MSRPLTLGPKKCLSPCWTLAAWYLHCESCVVDAVSSPPQSVTGAQFATWRPRGPHPAQAPAVQQGALHKPSLPVSQHKARLTQNTRLVAWGPVLPAHPAPSGLSDPCGWRRRPEPRTSAQTKLTVRPQVPFLPSGPGGQGPWGKKGLGHSPGIQCSSAWAQVRGEEGGWRIYGLPSLPRDNFRKILY